MVRRHDYSRVTFRTVKRDPLHDVLNAVRALGPDEMVEVSMRGASVQAREGLRNNIRTRFGPSIRTATDGGGTTMRVWRESTNARPRIKTTTKKEK